MSSSIYRWGGVLTSVSLCAILGVSGCQSPEGLGDPSGMPADENVSHVPTEPNVVNVIAIYNSLSPWLHDRDRVKVIGIYVSGLYLLGPKGLGVFGDGVIRPRLYVVERGPDGKKQQKLVKEWSFTVEQAIPWRGKEKRTVGWGYGLPLPFEGLDLSGREIQMVIGFERADGVMVNSSKQTFIVPLPAE